MRNMNWLGIAALILSIPFFVWGTRAAQSIGKNKTRWFAVLVALVCAAPAFVFVLYYTRFLGEPMWLYSIRTVSGSELAASPAGFLAGWIQARLVPKLSLSHFGKRILIPAVLAFALAIPYLKPILRPRAALTGQEQWNGEVCLQSTASTCGPASAVTILKRLGVNATEEELACEAFTSATGSENWYLARAIRRRGMQTRFAFSKTMDSPAPAIVGVRLRDSGNAGHFIALLEKHGDQCVFGDPMEGLVSGSMTQLSGKYDFTGFMLCIQRGAEPRQPR